MESFIAFFQDIPSSQRTLILASGVLAFWILEGVVPLFSTEYRRYQHALLNAVFTLTTMVVNFSLAFLIVKAADLTTTMEFGVMHWVPGPLFLQVLLGIMVLDLISAWFIHWIEHKVAWMWKFHLIHHSDTHVDVTTALRHHPGESVFRAVFTILAVFVAGAPIAVVFIYQTFSALFSQFNHANFRIPRALDKALSWIIVTPDMHKAHHHFQQPLTDTNYGNIFSIWDCLFGTFAYVPDPRKLVYGVDTHMDEREHDDVKNLMAIPFQPYRKRPDPPPAEKQDVLKG